MFNCCLHQFLFLFGVLIVDGYLLEVSGLHKELVLCRGFGAVEEVPTSVLVKERHRVVDLDAAVVQDGIESFFLCGDYPSCFHGK